MPSRPPTRRPAWAAASTRHQRYDARNRDARSKQFYASAAWKKARATKLALDPLCEVCRKQGQLRAASHVHHLVEIRADWDLRLEMGNLESLCHSCHSRLHAESRGREPRPSQAALGGGSPPGLSRP